MKELNWKDCLGNGSKYNLTTNSRWLTALSDNPLMGNFKIPNRKYLPKVSNEFHGVWIPEIPYQMLMRFTKEGDNVWSQFGGTGIDVEVSNLLKRNCIATDINVISDNVVYGDARTFEISNVDLILSHPPYWDIIKYSNDEADGSSKKSLLDYIMWFKEVVSNSYKSLKNNGYYILACGNIYKNSEEIELGEMLKNVLINSGFILKQHIIKDYGETKGKEAKNYNLNYYRQLKFGYGNFYGDNIYVLKKTKSLNNIKEVNGEIWKD